MVDSSQVNPESVLVLTEHDPAWELRFGQLSQTIVEAVGKELCAVEHIGSTSVPGLLAKPVIDMLVGVVGVPLSSLSVVRMQELGYQSRGEFGITNRHYFSRPDAHVHCFEIGQGQWDSHLLFREYLRESEDARESYASAKRILASSGNWSREYYAENKESVVEQMLVDAARWHRTRSSHS